MPISEVYNENCLHTLKRMPDRSVSLMLQDPPFGVTRNEWDKVPDFTAMWPEWLRVGKENCAYIFFGTQPFVVDLINSNRKMFRYDLIWYKPLGTGFLNANKMPLRNHEHIIVFYKKLPTYNPQMSIGKMRQKGTKNSKQSSNYGPFSYKVTVNDMYHPQSVFEFTNGDNTKENDHPTQKPLALIRYLIRSYSNPNDLVFDGYLGSGTTMIASYIEGRDFIGAELKPEYYIGLVKRFTEQTSQQQLFL
jgi:site-specific DNA-methyltransferase (adenine-specific)